MSMYSNAARLVRSLGRALRDAARWARRGSQPKQSRQRSPRRTIRLMDEALFPLDSPKVAQRKMAAALAASAAGRTIPPPVQHLTRLLNLMPGSRVRCPHLVMVETTLIADMKGGFNSLGKDTLVKAMDQLSELVPIAPGSSLDTLLLQMRRRYGELHAREESTRRAQERMGMVSRPAAGQPLPRSQDFMFGGATVTELPSSHMPGVAEIIVQPPPAARNDAHLGGSMRDALRHLEAGDLRAMRPGDSPTQWADTEVPEGQGFGASGSRNRA